MSVDVVIIIISFGAGIVFWRGFGGGGALREEDGDALGAVMDGSPAAAGGRGLSGGMNVGGMSIRV